MSTDDYINADQDHDLTEDIDSQDQDESEESEDDFNARKASKTLAEKLNKLEKKLEEKLARESAEDNESDDRAGEVKEEDQSPDIDSIVEQKLWKRDNAGRIDALDDDGKSAFETYKAQGVKPELALRLAEQDQGITTASTSNRQKSISSTGSSVDRSGDNFEESSTDRSYRSQFGVKPETAKRVAKQLKELE